LPPKAYREIPLHHDREMPHAASPASSFERICGNIVVPRLIDFLGIDGGDGRHPITPTVASSDFPIPSYQNGVLRTGLPDFDNSSDEIRRHQHSAGPLLAGHGRNSNHADFSRNRMRLRPKPAITFCLRCSITPGHGSTKALNLSPKALRLESPSSTFACSVKG